MPWESGNQGLYVMTEGSCFWPQPPARVAMTNTKIARVQQLHKGAPLTIKLSTSVGWWAWVAPASGRRKPASWLFHWATLEVTTNAKADPAQAGFALLDPEFSRNRRRRDGHAAVAGRVCVRVPPVGRRKESIFVSTFQIRRKNEMGASNFALKLPNYPYRKIN